MTLAAPETRPQTASARLLRIAIVSPYDFAYPGGVSQHVTNLDLQLRRLGHDVTIIAPSSKSPEELQRPNLVRLGRPVPIPTSGSIARITVSLTLGKKVAPLLAREKFDIIHLHEPLVPALPLTFLRLARDSALVGTFHAYASRKRALGASRILLNRWARRLDQRIAVSEAARSFVTRYFPGDYTIVPNGVDVEHFARRMAPLREFEDGKLNILFVGRMEKRKGFPHLLRAFAQVKWRFPDCRLIVVSPSASLDRESARIVAERGLQDVHLCGYVPYAELPRYYASADIFCSPATGDESQGIVLLEAMAAGKAIVASSIPGYRTVVTDEVNGLLVNPRDEAGFAGTLLRLLEDPALRDRLAAAGQAQAPLYRWETVTQQVLEVYQQAMAHRASLTR